jgi:hypothetical protein
MIHPLYLPRLLRPQQLHLLNVLLQHHPPSRTVSIAWRTNCRFRLPLFELVRTTEIVVLTAAEPAVAETTTAAAVAMHLV